MLARRVRTSPATLRLSDADRERALSALRAHYAAGQLTIAELERRAEHVYRSVTRRDIAACLRDLPPRGVRRFVLGHIDRLQRTVLRMHLLTYAVANAALVGVWELTGQGLFWPAIFLIPSTALAAGHAVSSWMLTRALGRLRW
jgi:hypothetical protein